MKHKPTGLTARFTLLLLASFAAAAVVFCTVRFGGGMLLRQYFSTSDFQQRYNERRIQDLLSYVDEHDLATTDTEAITRWVEKHHLILLEIYRFNVLRYTSSAPEESLSNDTEAPYYAWLSYYQIPFADGTAEVVIYADDTYRFFTWLTAAALGAALIVFPLVFLRDTRSLVRYIKKLSGEIQVMEGGDLDVPITLQGKDELFLLARCLDSMRRAFKAQKEEETNLYSANQAMVTAMSHDLRTPLTTLQIYTDILRLNKYTPEQMDEYLEIIDSKAAQIKQLSENIFEYSLISKQRSVQLEEPRPIREVFHDRLSEMAALLAQKQFRFDLELDWPEILVAVNSQYIKRLIDNLSSNLEKYADAEYPVLIRIEESENGASILFQNVVSAEPPEQEGTHIGLTNMEAMMQKMGGRFRAGQTATLFQVELWFPAAQEVRFGASVQNL